MEGLRVATAVVISTIVVLLYTIVALAVIAALRHAGVLSVGSGRGLAAVILTSSSLGLVFGWAAVLWKARR